jgi:uncharacterized membrane protein YgdD (TMEM256/DUF423 family)
MSALLALSALAGFLAVGLGAFGAHALEGRLGADAKGWWETATLYALVHAVAALAVALQSPKGLLAVAGWAFLIGIVLFAGSLYTMALSGIRPLGAVTPLGGLAFLIGWGCLFVTALRQV